MKQTLSVWVSALLLVMSVAVPTLERGTFAHETAVESEHDPGHCPPAHDHTVCTQVDSSRSSPAAPVQAAHEEFVVHWTTPAQAPRAVYSVLEEGYPTRAPPSV